MENDETWKKKLDREIEKRKKVEEQNRKLKEEIEKLKRISYPGPDLEVSAYYKIYLHIFLGSWKFYDYCPC